MVVKFHIEIHQNIGVYLLRKYANLKRFFFFFFFLTELKYLVLFFFSTYTNPKSGDLTRPLILLVLEYNLSPGL